MSRPDPLLARAARAPGACRWCDQPLSALARRRGEVCDAMDCRRRETDARVQARRVADLEAVRAAAAAAWALPALAAAPVLWLRHHASDLAPPASADVEELRTHLMTLEHADVPAPAFADETSPEPPSPPIAARLCALCRGRCCRQGLQGRAFLEPADLRDWLADRPGSNWAEAVDHWLGFLPGEHLHASCLFHGARGCTLPRERRSDVCNRFACSTLDELVDIAAAQPQAVVVVGIVESHATREAAMLTAQGARRLPPATPE
jgi:hypothetical protein